MNEHRAPKIISLCFVKLGNSPAKVGPMREAFALGLTRVSGLDLDYIESRPDSPRLNQRFPGQ
ncbi:MAG: hypothetical protein ACYST9_04280 [Planctomycetota bacterium]